MQIFGIEIRRADNLTLLRHVDKILEKNNVTRENIGDKARAIGALGALQNMLNSVAESDGYFSVCEIRTAAELCNICISRDRINFYQLSHCKNWGSMKIDHRELLLAMVLDDFRDVLNYK